MGHNLASLTGSLIVDREVCFARRSAKQLTAVGLEGVHKFQWNTWIHLYIWVALKLD